ncbi:MAG: DMT family transporter [Oscillatoria princeps RMCB-10]|jgi:drug/metabolite transporter (DMT)-like permease|nr:DMT family transporter [Oscillatoria princeps RMCB-10]
MKSISKSLENFRDKITGRAYLLLAVIIFAAANSVLRRLTQIGDINLIDGRNPISFCNVLFVGNLVALMVLVAIYGKQWHIDSLQRISGKHWLGLSGTAILSGALAPSLIFMALSQTAVNNVVLIGRIETPLILALSVILLRERVNRWVVTGSAVSFVGVILTILLQKPAGNMVEMGAGFSLGKGEVMALQGAVALAVSTIISKVTLKQIPLGIFSIFRTAVGTVVFAVIVTQMYGPAHFMDAFSPLLWQWMLFYGGVIVVGGQLLWFSGLKKTGASDVSLATSFSPIAGILAAYLLLGEVPTAAQYIGGSLILAGIAISQMGLRQKIKETEVGAKEMDMKAGFKGV